jgi:hypothetical protein
MQRLRGGVLHNPEELGDTIPFNIPKAARRWACSFFRTLRFGMGFAYKSTGSNVIVSFVDLLS